MPIWSLQYLSSRILKALVDGASTKYSGSWFQSTTTLWLTNIRRTQLFPDADAIIYENYSSSFYPNLNVKNLSGYNNV